MQYDHALNHILHKMIMDLANVWFPQQSHPSHHHHDNLAHDISSIPLAPPLDMSRPLPFSRNPTLPCSTTPLAYADVFIHDFMGGVGSHLL
jgi:hypothetical protein